MAKELIQKIDDETFSKVTNHGVVLVDFFADWCGPCRMLEPIVHALADELSDKITFVKVDVDQSPKVVTSLQITSIPTLVLFKNGKEINRVVGLKDLETLKKILLQAV